MATIKQIKDRLLTEALAHCGKVIVTDMSFNSTPRWGVKIDYPGGKPWYGGGSAKSMRSALMNAYHFFLAKNQESNPHRIFPGAGDNLPKGRSQVPNLTRKGNAVLAELAEVFQITFHKRNSDHNGNDSERAFLEMVLEALLKTNPPDMKPTDLTKDDFEGRIRAQIDNIR